MISWPAGYWWWRRSISQSLTKGFLPGYSEIEGQNKWRSARCSPKEIRCSVDDWQASAVRGLEGEGIGVEISETDRPGRIKVIFGEKIPGSIEWEFFCNLSNALSESGPKTIPEEKEV